MLCIEHGGFLDLPAFVRVGLALVQACQTFMLRMVELFQDIDADANGKAARQRSESCACLLQSRDGERHRCPSTSGFSLSFEFARRTTRQCVAMVMSTAWS